MKRVYIVLDWLSLSAVDLIDSGKGNVVRVPLAILFWGGGLYLVYSGVKDRHSGPILLLSLMVMAGCTFVLCACETAIARFEDKWREPENEIRARLDAARNKRQQNELRYQVETATFRLCEKYLDQPNESFAALLALVAIVDTGGTAIVASQKLLQAVAYASVETLETIAIVAFVVIVGELLGTLVGMRAPVTSLRWFAIPIWPFYFASSIVMNPIARAVRAVVRKIPADPGFGE